MTDKEIIKALECCVDEDCDDCPNRSGLFCVVKIESYALDLINRQQEQLDAAIAGQESLQKALAEKDREIERLNVENMLTMSERNAFRTSFYEVSNQLKYAKSEAVREFAEKLKENKFTHKNFGQLVYVEDIDNLIKEMAGDME